MSHADIGAMWDFKAINAGFVILKSTENAIRLWRMTCNMTSVARKVNDQRAFNLAIAATKKRGDVC